MKIGYLMQKGVRDVRTPPFSGPANHVREVIKELRNLGHQVRLLVHLDDRIWKSDDLAVFEPVSVRWMDHGPVRLLERVIRRGQYELQLPYLSLFESLRFALACCQELRGYDVLYERITWVGYGGGLAARWLKAPLVLEENGDQLAFMDSLGIAPQGLQRRLEVVLMHKAIKRASHVVATGDGWREHFTELWRVDRDKVITVENGTVLVELLRREQLRSFRANENQDQITTLACLGGFYPWHGVTILIRAFARAIAQGAQVRLLLIGSGPGENEARGLIKHLNIGDFVTFTGQLSAKEFALLLAEADIGVSPYCGRVEFSGLKLLDYKAAGLATIASGRNGQPAIIKHGQTGWIVPPCDEDALSEAIIQLSSDPELRKQMGRRARIEAENRHGWDHTAQQLEQLFTQLIAG